ncbi:MAG TPA: hypothetical protein VMU82_11505 [Acetobacteraceae bacterium]|nr:hypothetical protein [Acetobacteraceae bacterium]
MVSHGLPRLLRVAAVVALVAALGGCVPYPYGTAYGYSGYGYPAYGNYYPGYGGYNGSVSLGFFSGGGWWHGWGGNGWRGGERGWRGR